MTAPEFIVASIASHRAELIELNIEYVSWVMSEIKREFGVSAEDVVGMSASEYVHSVIDKVCGGPPSTGVFYLVRVNGQLAGMMEVESNSFLRSWTDFDRWRPFAFDLGIPIGVKMEAWTQQEADQYEADLQQLHDQGAFYAHVGYILAAGRKPE